MKPYITIEIPAKMFQNGEAWEMFDFQPNGKRMNIKGDDSFFVLIEAYPDGTMLYGKYDINLMETSKEVH